MALCPQARVMPASTSGRPPCEGFHWREHSAWHRFSSNAIHKVQTRSTGPRTPVMQAQAVTQPLQGKLEKEKHKLFDEVVITVRSGKGGDGEIAQRGKGRTVDNFKYRPGSNLPKRIWLPAADPADGADGADVKLVADPYLDSLLHLHSRSTHTARHGANGNPAEGSSGPLTGRGRGGGRPRSPPLRIGVPLGTVVRRRRGGAVIGELVNPGDEVVVARGGRGGIGAVAPSHKQNVSRRQQRYSDEEVVVVEDENWKLDTKGLPGEEVRLQLLLRVVADVGIVGLPNAGKSSLLAAMTRAAPNIAPYPFTTLMPNLGVLRTGGEFSTAQAVLADLPGLIEGAHEGRGLGRMFLRHLRRTRVVLHVVDAAAPDPAADYWAVREELRMYNPAYCARPHVVVLNKMDLEDAAELREEVAAEVMAMARQLRKANEGGPSLPAAVVAVSAKEGTGVAQVSAALQPLLGLVDEAEEYEDEYLEPDEDPEVAGGW